VTHWYTTGRRCVSFSFVGLDGDAYSLELAKARISEARFSDRIELVQSTMEDFDAQDEYDAFAPMIERLSTICGAHGRDPSTLARSIGIFVRPPGTPADVHTFTFGPPLEGTDDDILSALERFADIGATQVELAVPGDLAAAFERLARVVEKAASI